MTDKELRKLSRAELLEMLIAQSTQLETCQKKLAAAEADLRKRELMISKAGSIAEASLLLSGIFEAAQFACQQYTENVRQLSGRQEKVCAELEAESRAKASQIIAAAEKERADIERETRIECEAMRRKAQEESQQYWADVSGRLAAFCDAHAGLRELLSMVTPPEKQE